MAKIEDLIIDLKGLKNTVQDAVDRAVLGDSFDVVKINKDQLASGFDANGNVLGQYAESTKALRSRKGLQTSFIDLNFTGRSYNSIDTKKTGNKGFEITSNPQWDQQRFPNAIGIAPSNEDKLTAIVVENIESVLNVKFK